METVTLLLNCKDAKGIVLSVTEFVYKNGGNVLEIDQHIDNQEDVFFMRVKWSINDFLIAKDKIDECFQTLVADKFEMNWQIYHSDYVPNMAIFVTKLNHCLYDILGRWQSGEWEVNIPMIISNHLHLKPIADQFNIPFYHLPVTKENKVEAEAEQLALLKKYKVDFVVLARYMQILSSDFISHYDNRAINIHHSFLPAFPGAKPYHSAHKRGVKIIGATSHYITEHLDAGPIIEQEIARVNHNNTIQDLMRKGKDLEKLVLSRAIYNHLQRKVMVYNNKTIVFD